ncbi:hypothetical protein EW145_g4172 [Phellinidium pouzarii]|uniref:Uncharacterized protein n=1 Tax=Phellinidium pouzarii TaxID=167371 RepID=A0A4S4L9K0_9AGAM|nr:hypothetical protein EW145_g4172 [Phellinidium pouzarii]
MYKDRVLKRSLSLEASTAEHAVHVEPLREELAESYTETQADLVEELNVLKERMDRFEKSMETSQRQEENVHGNTKILANKVKEMVQDARNDDKKREENARDLEACIYAQQHHLEKLMNMRIIEMGKFMTQQYTKGLVNLLGFGTAFAHAMLYRMLARAGSPLLSPTQSSPTQSTSEPIKERQKLSSSQFPVEQRRSSQSPVEWTDTLLANAKFYWSSHYGRGRDEYRLDKSFKFTGSDNDWVFKVNELFDTEKDEYFLACFKADLLACVRPKCISDLAEAERKHKANHSQETIKNLVKAKSMLAVIDSDNALSYIMNPLTRESAHALVHPNFEFEVSYKFGLHSFENVVRFDKEGHPVFKKDIFSQAIDEAEAAEAEAVDDEGSSDIDFESGSRQDSVEAFNDGKM